MSDPRLYAPLFEPTTIKSLRLANRIVMAPMTRSFAGPEGVPNDRIAAYYARRARYGVGLILTEGVAVNMTDAHGDIGIPSISTNTQEAAWRRVVEAVHAEGGKIGIQLWHCGRLGHSRAMPEGICPVGPSALIADEKGFYVDPADPSTFDGSVPFEVPHELSESEVLVKIEEFANCAERAQRAGFDLVELHGAHGYLIHSFLNSKSNHRNDEFGGNAERRGAFPVCIVQAIRARCGKDWPIAIRLSQFTTEDIRELTWKKPNDLAVNVQQLLDAGIDVFHGSQHKLATPGFGDAGPSFAEALKKLSGKPTIGVGGVTYTTAMFETLQGIASRITDPVDAADAIREGCVDLVAVGRSLIANPDWCEKVRSGRWSELEVYEKTNLAELY